MYLDWFFPLSNNIEKNEFIEFYEKKQKEIYYLKKWNTGIRRYWLLWTIGIYKKRGRRDERTWYNNKKKEINNLLLNDNIINNFN